MRWLLVVAVALGCASPPPPAPLEYRTVAQPVDVESLSAVEALGYRLYLRDIVASRSTDAALASVDLRSTGALGWIVVQTGDQYVTRFIDGSSRSVVDVFTDPFSNTYPRVTRRYPPEPLGERETAMWRARQLASSQEFRACSDRYNTVVVPASSEPGSDWFVYLLAATVEPNLIMLGGHHRYRVDPLGTRIIERFPMTKSCMTARYDETMAMMSMSHIVSGAPIESHVYLSLIHDIPLSVIVMQTEELFRIEDGRVHQTPFKPPDR
ncbi:MAG: hypothetical protein AAF430_18270 [Myxococcota bacterium]